MEREDYSGKGYPYESDRPDYSVSDFSPVPCDLVVVSADPGPCYRPRLQERSVSTSSPR